MKTPFYLKMQLTFKYINVNIIHERGDFVERALTITEASKLMKVSRQTVYTWIEEKKINFTTLPSGKKRIPASEIKKYIGGN